MRSVGGVGEFIEQKHIDRRKSNFVNREIVLSIERKISVVATLARAWDGSPLTHRLATMATQMRHLFIERCLVLFIRLTFDPF